MPEDIDPFADAESTPSLSFANAPVGTSYKFTVLEPAKLVQSRDYETGEPATWPDGNPKMSAVLVVEVDGEKRSIWARKPSSMFSALAKAQADAGARFEAGGAGTVTFASEKPHENKRFNAIKQYSATYQPPKPADPFEAKQDSDEQIPF